MENNKYYYIFIHLFLPIIIIIKEKSINYKYDYVYVFNLTITNLILLTKPMSISYNSINDMFDRLRSNNNTYPLMVSSVNPSVSSVKDQT